MALLEFRRPPEGLDVGHDVSNNHHLDTLQARKKGSTSVMDL